ncbi:TPA: hypothetical protein ACGO17_002142 [Streptococcus suis]
MTSKTKKIKDKMSEMYDKLKLFNEKHGPIVKQGLSNFGNSLRHVASLCKNVLEEWHDARLKADEERKKRERRNKQKENLLVAIRTQLQEIESCVDKTWIENWVKLLPTKEGGEVQYEDRSYWQYNILDLLETKQTDRDLGEYAVVLAIRLDRLLDSDLIDRMDLQLKTWVTDKLEAGYMTELAQSVVTDFARDKTLEVHLVYAVFEKSKEIDYHAMIEKFKKRLRE